MFDSLVICTDLDRTLLPNGKQDESTGARNLFKLLASQPQVSLVYVTGRHLALIQEAIKTYDIPLPDYVIADVGSTIYSLNKGNWTHLEEWRDFISCDWQGASSESVLISVAGIDGLKPQEDEKQGEFKASFYADPNVDAKALIDKVMRYLDNMGIKAGIIWSVNEVTQTGLLDILPVRADKQKAIEFLMDYIDATHDQLVFSGDSGNDISVITSAINAVLVSNATEEVKAEITKLEKNNKTQSNCYVAKGGYLGMNGNYAAGILEGIAYYRPDVDEWLQQQVK